jgi:hypothetical protein
MKNSNDSIANRNRDLQVCTTVAQAPPHALKTWITLAEFLCIFSVPPGKCCDGTSKFGQYGYGFLLHAFRIIAY